MIIPPKLKLSENIFSKYEALSNGYLE